MNLNNTRKSYIVKEREYILLQSCRVGRNWMASLFFNRLGYTKVVMILTAAWKYPTEVDSVVVLSNSCCNADSHHTQILILPDYPFLSDNKPGPLLWTSDFLSMN